MTTELALSLIAAGFLVGMFSALLGVGGGVLMVPLLVILVDKTQHLAEGTSLLVIVPTAVVGVLAHRKRGYVDVRTGAALGVGGIAGAWIGALLALKIDAGALQKVFAVFMLVVGLRLVITGVWSRRELPVETAGPG